MPHPGVVLGVADRAVGDGVQLDAVPQRRRVHTLRELNQEVDLREALVPGEPAVRGAATHTA